MIRYEKLTLGWIICLAAYLVSLTIVVGANKDIVAKHRVKYPTPLGVANTNALLRDVAAEVKGGIYKKTTGNNCLGYSCDIICFADGNGFDILQDSEGQAIPVWNSVSGLDKTKCELISAPNPPDPPGDSDSAVIREIRDLVKQIRDLLL